MPSSSCAGYTCLLCEGGKAAGGSRAEAGQGAEEEAGHGLSRQAGSPAQGSRAGSEAASRG